MIERDDPISRYLFDTRHYSRENKRVKQGAFLPDGNLETSVYFTKNLAEDAIWVHGETYAANGRTLRGRAEISVDGVQKTKLTVKAEDPPPLHGVIVGWPTEKDQQKALALELAQSSELRLR